MEGKDKRLDLIRSFTVKGFRLDPDRWWEFVSKEKNQVIFNSFFKSQDVQNLFICWDPESELSVSFHAPLKVQTKVICVFKTSPEALTEDNMRQNLTIQEVLGEDATTSLSSVCQQVSCLLLGNSPSLEAEELQMTMEGRKNSTEGMEAQIEGRTFLPPPGGARLHGDSETGKLLHTCMSTIPEWVELGSEVLNQDSSEAGLLFHKRRPSGEFTFWENRLKKLLSLQQQMQSSRAQQVCSLVQQVDGVLWSRLRNTCSSLEEGLREAEEVMEALRPLKERLEELEGLEYQELVSSVVDVVEQVHQVQVQSKYYRNPDRLFVLLVQICDLYIQKSRKFLRGQDVMQGLESDPGRVLDDVSLVIWTLQTLREAFSKHQSQNQNQSQGPGSDSPSHLGNFSDLNNLLKHLQSIQEVLCLTLQLSLLDQVVLSGANSGMWTDEIQDVYQDFLCHLKVLSESPCDPMDPEDQSLQLYVDRFMVQLGNQETLLGSVLTKALEDCCKSSSAAQLLEMFWFLLDRPLIKDQLSPKLKQLVNLVLVELDHTEQVCIQREDSESPSRSMSPAAARLWWTNQLRLRAEDSLNSYRTVQDLLVDPGEPNVVLQRFQKVGDLLQVFRDQARMDWIGQLDSDCGFILDHPVIQQDADGLLEVGCSPQLCTALRDLRCVSKEKECELSPQAARLLTCRDDITQSYLILSHMVSCYNQVLNDALEVELPLIQDQLQDLNQHLSELQGKTWTCEGLQELVQQERDKVLIVHTTLSEARANMDTMTHIIQGWAELHLLQHLGDSQLRGGAYEQVQGRLHEDGQQLLRLIQVNRSLYGAEESSQSWTSYLDYVDDRVQVGLLQLMLRTLQSLCDSMKPQSSGGVWLVTRLTVQDAESVFEPSVGGGLSDHLKSIITDVYRAANELPRISVSRHGDYQVCVQQLPPLCELEQEVMCHLQQVEQEAERLRVGLDRYSYLWESDMREVMEEFLTYGRLLGPEELEAEVTPPTLQDYRREIQSLTALSREVAHLDDVIDLQGWLQVDLRPFRESLLTIMEELKHLYTENLLHTLTHSLQQLSGGEEDSPLSGFPLRDSVLLLEEAGGKLPELLTAQLQQQMIPVDSPVQSESRCT